MSCEITADEFKTYFDRGQFTYSDDLPDVRDTDIERAISETEAVINEDLFDDDTICQKAKYYLTAHFLTNDIEAGDSGGQAVFNMSSRSADGISASLAIPEWMLEGEFAFYSTTYYGQKYLIICKPYMGGAVYCVGGSTTP